MPCQPIEHFALRFAGSQVPYERAFRRVFTQLLHMGLIILHRPLPVLIFYDGGTENSEIELTNVKSRRGLVGLQKKRDLQFSRLLPSSRAFVSSSLVRPLEYRSAAPASVCRSLP